jgi:hypothetical protein
MLVRQNNYPLRDWHFEHMQKTVVKYVSGISEYASPYQKRQHKKYSGNLSFVQRNIQFDIKHGVTREEVDIFLEEVRNDSSFADVRKNLGSGERLEQLQI